MTDSNETVPANHRDQEDPFAEGSGTADEAGDIIFAATLTPHRSLGTFGFSILMGIFGLTCFIAGLMFYLVGAWPVVGFLGLDVLILWLAFRLNYRAARACELISLSRDRLLIRKVKPNGRADEVMFNPYWVRLEVTEIEDEGIARIVVRTRDQSVSVGSFLNPEDRRSFAHALRAALAEAKSPGI